MTLRIIDVEQHARGKIYNVNADGKAVRLLITFHALERMQRWKLSHRQILRALLEPEEVLRGHRNRYVAHRRSGRHVVRVIYEYAHKEPVLVTVYYLPPVILKAEEFMKIKYSRDADVLLIQLREGKLAESRDIAEVSLYT